MGGHGRHRSVLGLQEEVEGREHTKDIFLLPGQLAGHLVGTDGRESDAEGVQLGCKLGKHVAAMEIGAVRFQKDGSLVPVQVTFPADALFVLVLLRQREPLRAAAILVDREMLQIDPTQYTFGIPVIDGEIRAILTEFTVGGRELVLLLVAEHDAAASQEIADLALLVRLAEDRAAVHILVVCLDPVFLAVEHIGLHRGILEQVLHLVAGADDVVGDGAVERRILVEELVIDLHREILRDDGRFLSGGLADDLQSELVEGPALEFLLAETLGEGFGGLAGEGDQQDLGWVHLLDIDQVTDLSDRGHGLAAASAADDKHIVLKGNDGFTLLSIERIGENGIEIAGVVGELFLDELLVVDLLESGTVGHSLVESLDQILFRMAVQLFRPKDLIHFGQQA